MTAVTYGYKLLKKVVSLKLKYVKEKLRIHKNHAEVLIARVSCHFLTTQDILFCVKNHYL